MESRMVWIKRSMMFSGYFFVIIRKLYSMVVLVLMENRKVDIKLLRFLI